MEDKIQRLSEGMDFIEESTGMSSEPLSFSETDSITISEASSTPSPYKVLGTARGCFAPINEFSRNRRLYSPELWPTVLQNEELKNRLSSRAVFGCLGHADKLVDDRDIQEGKVSHIVTLLEVRNDQKTGKPYLYGELEILDTPAGRILEAMYKGGANLYVSSRAAGKLVPVPGQNYSLVKPDQYHVHTFDIVCRPGFLQAHPMFEATNESVNEDSIDETNRELRDRVTIKRGENVKKAEDNLRKAKNEVEAKQYMKGEDPVDWGDDEAWHLSQARYELDKANKKFDKNVALRQKAQKNNSSCEKSSFDEAEEISQLKSQLDQLTKIIEKVVDDVYEESEDNSIEEAKKKDKELTKKAAIPAFLTIMAESDISAEVLSDIIDMIKGDISND